jgi:hypothetical protein
MAYEPPETTPLEDDEDVEVGFCVGCDRLEVEVVLVSDEPEVSEEVEEAVEPDDEPLE